MNPQRPSVWESSAGRWLAGVFTVACFTCAHGLLAGWLWP